MCPGRSSPTASQGSLGPAGAQGCLWLASPPKRVPLCAAAWFGRNVPSFPKQARAACSEAGPGGLDGSPTKAQNQSLGAASWQSVFDSVLEHQAQRGAALQHHSRLGPAQTSLGPRAMQALSGPKPPWPCLGAGAFCCLKGTANLLPCVQAPGLASKCLAFPSGNEPPVASQGRRGLMALSQTPPNQSLKPSPGKRSSLSSMVEHRPSGGLRWKATPAYFPPRLRPCLETGSASAVQCSLDPACVQGLSVA